VGKCTHDTKTTLLEYWIGLLAEKKCRVQYPSGMFLNWSDIKIFFIMDGWLLDGIKVLDRVKWHPCWGYKRLMVEVALSTILELLYKHCSPRDRNEISDYNNFLEHSSIVWLC